MSTKIMNNSDSIAKAVSMMKLEQCLKKVRATIQYRLIGRDLMTGAQYIMLAMKAMRILSIFSVIIMLILTQ